MNNPSEFSTERLQLAIFLHAANKLQFLRCEPNGGDKVRFVFDDPSRISDELELAYDNGQPVSAVALFASQKFLRRKMSEAKNDVWRPGDRHAYRQR